jgi:hypothetical protein
VSEREKERVIQIKIKFDKKTNDKEAERHSKERVRKKMVGSDSLSFAA